MLLREDQSIKAIYTYNVDICGLYYKPMTIVNDDSRVINKLEASLTDNARDIIYDCHKQLNSAVLLANKVKNRLALKCSLSIVCT